MMVQCFTYVENMNEFKMTVRIKTCCNEPRKTCAEIEIKILKLEMILHAKDEDKFSNKNIIRFMRM